MVKNKFFKKAAVAGLATVMTVAGSVMAFANNTTMYVGDDSVDCELTLPYEGARATMKSVLTVHTQTAMHGTMTVITVQLRYMNRKNF